MLFDAYWWEKGPVSNREVMREILRTWLLTFDDDLTVFVPHAIKHSVAGEILALTGRDVKVVSTRVRPHGIGLLTVLQWRARGAGYDAVLTQNFSLRHSRSGTFVHDVLFKSNPSWFTWLERRYFSLITASIARASVILTSSHSEATRVTTLTRAREVVPVGLGPRSSMLRAPAEEPSLNLRPGQFVLSVGRFNLRKNLTRVAQAAEPLVSPDCPLVIVGDKIPIEGQANRGFARAIASGAIVAPGFVSDSSLRWLYENCRAFVMASLGEGFGMPVAEAAAIGKPVVASDIAVFREIVADAFFVDPYSVNSIRAGIQEAMDTNRVAHPVAELNWESVARNIREQLVAK